MARSVQVLKNTTGSVCVKIEGDDAATTLLDASLNYALPENGTSSIKRLMWTMASGSLTINWKVKAGTPSADKVATRLSGSGSWNSAVEFRYDNWQFWIWSGWQFWI